MEGEEEADEGDGEEELHETEGIPIAPSDRKTQKPEAVFVLEKASLEVAKVGKSYHILNFDNHAHFFWGNNKNLADYRPDIVHQALLSILDSPLRLGGCVLFMSEPIRVFFLKLNHMFVYQERISDLLIQLLQKLSITAVGKHEKLLRVIKNPVTQYLPANSRKTGWCNGPWEDLLRLH